ncbi:hypothetical protein F4782DRAFT_533408 [Xylaria castorea]|nr:hypothetical protein F4782DRAFT_533408 [Xylaria castorea]
MREWSPVASNDFIDKSHSCLVNYFPVKKPYVIQSINPNTSQLIPTKGLHRNRHPDLLRPGASLQRPRSEYHESPAWPPHPEVLTPGPKRAIPQCTDYFTRQPLKPSYPQTSRPVTMYSAYRPPEANPSQKSRDHIIRTSISLCESPSTYSEDHYDARCNYNNATYSYAPSPLACSPRQDGHLTREYSFSGTNIQRESQIQQHRSHSQATIRVDGVDFNLVSSNTPVPAPAPVPDPVPNPIRMPPPPPTPTSIPSHSLSYGQRSSASSICSTKLDNLGYGALNPSPLCPKQASFINRARARLERRFVSVGLRSPPSFKVHSVTKSPLSTLRMSQADGGKVKSPTPTPPSTESSWAERMHEIKQELPRAEYREKISSWQSVDQWRAGLPTPAPSPCALKRRSGLCLDTSFTHVPLPEGIAELEAPLNNPPKSEHKDGNRANGSLLRQYSDDSLFPGGSIRHQASSPILSSEYPQRRAVAVNTESRGGITQWRHPSTQAQMPRAQSSISLHQWNRDERVDLHTSQSSLSLGQPFSFDDRRNLPSQNQYTLSRKKGMQLR